MISDLKQIEVLLNGLEDRLNRKIEAVNQTLGERIELVNKSLADRIEAVNQTLGERIEKVNQTLGERIEKVNLAIEKTRLEMKRNFNRVHKDQNIIIKHFDEEFLSLRARVDKLEQKTNISPLT